MPPPLPDEQAALLRAIIESPDDDTPRLVYADWLHEHGDEEQAEFIRSSIALSALDEQAVGRDELAERVRNTWRERGRDWLAAIGVVRHGESEVSRGLPHALTYYSHAKGFLSDADAVFSRLPVRALRLNWEGYRGTDDDLKTFATLPGLARIDDLTLVGLYSYRPWKAVIESPYLRARRLGIVNCAFNDDAALALGECQNLSCVDALDLADNAMGPEGILALVRSPHLQHIKEFSFVANTEVAPYEKESDEEDEDEEGLDRGPYLELVAALTARFGNADALTTWLR